MENVNDILARLQKGETPEAIAEAYAKAINDAIALDKKQKEEAAAKAAAVQKEKELDALAQNVSDAIIAYIRAADPSIADLLENEGDYSALQMRSMLDTSIKSAKLMVKFASNIVDAAPEATSADEAIEKFLKNFGL